MSEKKGKFVAYARVAAASPEGGTSLDTQTAVCVELAVSEGYSEVDAIVLHEVWSGVVLDRPQLTVARRMAADDEIKALFVSSIDRLSRDAVDLLMLMREFSTHGVDVHFVQGPSDSGPQAEFFNAFIGLCANYERSKRRTQTVRGMAAVASTGRMVTGVHAQPYGYDRDPTTGNRVINEVEAEVVVRVFGLYADGLSLFRIAKLLNAEGVKTKKGKPWSPVGLLGMLSNASYIGVDYYGKSRTVLEQRSVRKRVSVLRDERMEIRGYSPPVVPEDLFDVVNERLGGLKS